MLSESDEISNGSAMRISVVVPVFNAVDYVEAAVNSALAQDQVIQVLLVEDGSTDGSLAVCQKLTEVDPRVELFRHAGGANRGAGASRNLGIRHARADFVSFLDADDYMLPDRFAVAEAVFKRHPDADGVYEAVGYHFESDALRSRHAARGTPYLSTVRYPIAPDRLFNEQSPVGNQGYANTDGWVVKRAFFEICGLFDEDLLLHEDTNLFIRFSMAGAMYPGEIERAVAVRRVHDGNRITQERPPMERLSHVVRMWCSAWRWARSHGYKRESDILVRRMIRRIRAVETEEINEHGYLKALGVRYRRTVELCPELKRLFSFKVFVVVGPLVDVTVRLFSERKP